MNAGKGSKTRWGVAAAGGILMIGAVVALFRSPPETRIEVPKTPNPRPPAVRLVDLGKNEAALTDPTPLFLPTEWNSGENALPEYVQRNPGGSFKGYPAKLQFPVAELGLNFPAEVIVPSKPADVLIAGKSSSTYIGLGSEATAVTPVSARKAFVEVTIAGDGRKVLAQALTDANPPGGGGWQPMEFLVAVDAIGTVGPPILTESSRDAAVDGYFQNYLVKTLHAGERLAPGFYRICVGP